MLKVHALDGLDEQAEITDWVSIETAERDMGQGAWIVKLPESNATDLLLGATWPGIAINDTETGWWWGGFQTGADVEFDRGRYTHTFAGHDFQAELDARLYYPSDQPGNALGETSWDPTFGVNTLSLTANAFNIVDLSMGPLAETDRQLAGLVMGTDPNAGPVKAWTPGFGTPLQLLSDAFEGENYTFRLRYDMDDSGPVKTPRLLFETPLRATSKLMLDATTGEITKGQTSQRAALATATIAAGEWIDPDDKTLGRRFHKETTAAADWRTRYRETYVDRGELDPSALQVENEAYHRSQGQRRSASLDDATLAGWGRDIDLGWLVRVRLGRGNAAEVLDLPVVGQTLTNMPDKGWIRKVAVGANSLSGAAALMESIGRLSERVRRLEG